MNSEYMRRFSVEMRFPQPSRRRESLAYLFMLCSKNVMPDVSPSLPARTPPEACPHLRGSVRRYRCLLARGHDPATARRELVAYLVVLRPGLPRVLAEEQATMVIAACGAAPRPPAKPPRALLVALATPWLGNGSGSRPGRPSPSRVIPDPIAARQECPEG